MQTLQRQALRRLITKRPDVLQERKRSKKKLSLFLLKRIELNIMLDMKLLEKTPITNIEKWLNRIVTIALAVFEIVKELIKNWPQ